MITLKNLAQATEQEVYDQVAVHLLKQNKKSLKKMNGMMGCAYRGYEDTKCAAGCLIGDEEYFFSMENIRWFTLDSAPDVYVDLITQLQAIHDASPVHMWRQELMALASKRRLNTFAIDNLK